MDIRDPHTTTSGYAVHTVHILRAIGWKRIPKRSIFKQLMDFTIKANEVNFAPLRDLVPTPEVRQTRWFIDSWTHFGHAVDTSVASTGSPTSYMSFGANLRKCPVISPPQALPLTTSFSMPSPSAR